MRKLIALITFFIFILSALNAQTIPSKIAGKWMGKLNVGIELRLVFNFEISGDTIFTTIDSPDQGVNGIPTEKTTLINDEITVTIPVISGSFKGKYIADSVIIRGIWFQSGGSMPISLSKIDFVEPIKRPQNPVKPYPYKVEEVVFKNKSADSVFLAGTLTIPEGAGPFKAVILVSGSGPQNRDEFLLGHSPFLVLSDRLTRKGIIVLRYDDRGVANSTGDFSKATTQDFASDADAAVKYLMSRKDLNISEIGIAGHSEGGLIAPITATENKNVDFIVMLVGPGISGDSILILQGDLIAKASGFTDSMIYYYSAIRHDIINVVLAENDMDIISKKIIAINKEFLKTTPQYILDEMQMSAKDSTSAVDFYANVWTKYFLSFDPRPILEKLKIPVLALNGTNDLQVPYKENLMAIEEALKKSESKNYKVLELKGLNHLFQVSVSGSPNEYSSLEETFNEEAMEIIVNWILQL